MRAPPGSMRAARTRPSRPSSPVSSASRSRRRGRRGARPGQRADDPALGGRLRGPEPRVHRPRRWPPGPGSAEIVAPPLMLQTWTMATPRSPASPNAGGSPVESDGEAPLLRAATGPATWGPWPPTRSSTSCATCDSVTWCRPRRSSSRSRRRRQTRIGPGRFVTWVTTYTTSTARSSAASASGS